MLCLGPTKQPLPTHRHRRDRPRVEYGALADNIDLVRELAPVSILVWIGCRHFSRVVGRGMSVPVFGMQS